MSGSECNDAVESGQVNVLSVHLKVGMHDLTYDQRAVWGTCSVCHARHGERCRPDETLATHQWTHSDRIEQAPARVRIEALP